MSDALEMQDRYDRRKTEAVANLYDPFRPASMLARQERDRAMLKALRPWLAHRKLSDISIMEVGCGGGGNLLHLIQLGAEPVKIFANELLPERMALAKRNLPAAVTFLPGDATRAAVPIESIDLVLQSTVFSSILDTAARHELAHRMTGWLRPGGAVLWYDFIFDNPANADVRGVPIAEVGRLFPTCRMVAHRVTLAPPIARRLGVFTHLLYPMLNALPFLRTHAMCLISKPL